MWQGSARAPAGGSYGAHPDSLAVIQEKGREGRGSREGEGRGGRRRGKGRREDGREVRPQELTEMTPLIQIQYSKSLSFTHTDY